MGQGLGMGEWDKDSGKRRWEGGVRECERYQRKLGI